MTVGNFWGLPINVIAFSIVSVVVTGGSLDLRGVHLRPGVELVRRIDSTAALHHEAPGVLVMADCGSGQDAVAAADTGADLVGTTLAGYTGERPRTEGPDLELLAELVAALAGLPVVAEGRIRHSRAGAAGPGRLRARGRRRHRDHAPDDDHRFVRSRTLCTIPRVRAGRTG